MKRQRCESCRWLLQYPSQSIGQCRRYPPTQNTEAGWLYVRAFDWCGEWADAKNSSEQAEQRIQRAVDWLQKAQRYDVDPTGDYYQGEGMVHCNSGDYVEFSDVGAVIDILQEG